MPSGAVVAGSLEMPNPGHRGGIWSVNKEVNYVLTVPINDNCSFFRADIIEAATY